MCLWTVVEEGATWTSDGRHAKAIETVASNGLTSPVDMGHMNLLPKGDHPIELREYKRMGNKRIKGTG